MEKNKISYWNINAVPDYELLSRKNKAIKKFSEQNSKLMIFFSSAAVRYFTGVSFIQTERPIVYVLRDDGKSWLLVPLLEYEHALQNVRSADNIICYKDYPGEKHPMLYLKELLVQIGGDSGIISSDSSGNGCRYGYEGADIGEICPDAKIIYMPRLLQNLYVIKSAYDISVIRESARWANYAHALLHEYTMSGAKETEVELRASSEAAAVMFKTMAFNCPEGCNSVVKAGYRGQIGVNSYYPHALTNNAVFKNGDNLVSIAYATILGYESELERVMFVGCVSEEQEKYYSHAVNLQAIAINEIKPGKKCSDVDKEVMRYYRENDLLGNRRHHTGHALGHDIHEAPYLDINDDTVIEAGMVFSAEPGIYVRDLGGFRMSDTVLVTDEGAEMITYFPKGLENAVCGKI